MSPWPKLLREADPSPASQASPVLEHGAARPVSIDDELDAQKECYDAMAPLDSQARARVLRWLAETLEVGR